MSATADRTISITPSVGSFFFSNSIFTSGLSLCLIVSFLFLLTHYLSVRLTASSASAAFVPRDPRATVVREGGRTEILQPTTKAQRTIVGEARELEQYFRSRLKRHDDEERDGNTLTVPVSSGEIDPIGVRPFGQPRTVQQISDYDLARLAREEARSLKVAAAAAESAAVPATEPVTEPAAIPPAAVEAASSPPPQPSPDPIKAEQPMVFAPPIQSTPPTPIAPSVAPPAPITQEDEPPAITPAIQITQEDEPPRAIESDSPTLSPLRETPTSQPVDEAIDLPPTQQSSQSPRDADPTPPIVAKPSLDEVPPTSGSLPSSPSSAASSSSSSSSSLSHLTSPSAPLGPSVDVSRMYDSAARREAREEYLRASVDSPLPDEVRTRKINNVIFDDTNREKPINEEWSEIIVEKKVTVKAPGIITSFTSPDGGLEMSLFLDPTGRIGYSMKLHGDYSLLARQMVEDGVIDRVEDVEGRFLLPALLDLALDDTVCLFQTQQQDGGDKAEVNMRLEKGFSLWHPVPKAERSEYGESYTQVTLWNVPPNVKEDMDGAASSACGSFSYDIRLFNIGFGIRGNVNPRKPPTSANPFPEEGPYIPVSWSMGLRLQDGSHRSECIANNYEEPFRRLQCQHMKDAMMTPVTIALPSHLRNSKGEIGKTSRGPYHMAILQASGPAFIRSTAKAVQIDPNRPTHTELILTTKGEAKFEPSHEDEIGIVRSRIDGRTLVTPTSWHLVIFGGALRHLSHASHLAPLLCEPPSKNLPSVMDTRWIPSGKLLRITKFTTSDAKLAIDWSEENQFRLIHFDAGWYGDEYKKESSAKQVFHAFQDQLDLAAVAAYANERGRRLCLYVNELALRDTNDLSRIYADWGIGGVKFGFVEVGDARSMRILHQRVITFGLAGMFINIHDSYRPRGLSRTYPFLVAQEGVRGEERKPDATHHTILPFVRTLQGAADYTPRYLGGAGLLCTKAHQLALPLIVYSPIQSLFWAEPLNAISDALTNWNKELLMWRRMPSIWDDTRVLVAQLGEVASIARRSGEDWYVGTISNTKERTFKLNMNVFFQDWQGHPSQPGLKMVNQVGYIIHSYKDASWKARLDPFRIKVQKRQLYWLKPPPSTWANGVEPQPPSSASTLKMMVIEDGTFTFDLAPSGGHTLYLTPATPAAIAQIEEEQNQNQLQMTRPTR